MTSIQERIQDIARAVFDDDELTLTSASTAIDVPGWDSLGHLNFMFSLEDAFGVQFTEDEFVGFENVGALERLLEDKLAAAPGSGPSAG